MVMKRELLFDVDPHRRVWTSIFDIPPGTLARPSTGDYLLYVTSAGNGWWVNEDRADTEIPAVEELGSGWSLLSRHNGHAPFCEVL